MISTQDHIIIERFIEGALTGIELKEFQERMTSDGSFKDEVEFYHLLYSGISRSREHELTDFITSNVSVKHYTPRSVIAIVIVMLIIIISGVGMWNYVEKDAESGNKNFFTFDFFNKQKSKTGTAAANDRQKSERKISAKQDIVSEEDSIEDAHAQLQAKNDSATAIYTQSRPGDSLSDDENIVIKKDEMISSVEMPVFNRTQGQKTDAAKAKESLAREAAEKLNPGAQLPEEADLHTNTLQVEFWESPVNYKGFKLVKNKLVLFGIDKPEAVKLYSLNDQLYMQYGQMVSKLNPTYDYQSFLALKESEIPQQLK